MTPDPDGPRGQTVLDQVRALRERAGDASVDPVERNSLYGLLEGVSNSEFEALVGALEWWFEYYLDGGGHQASPGGHSEYCATELDKECDCGRAALARIAEALRQAQDTALEVRA